MENQFADYETSKILKELEFNDECFGFYAYNPIYDEYILFNGIKTDKGNTAALAAPLWQQIEEWLWNNKIFIEINRLVHEKFCFVVYMGDPIYHIYSFNKKIESNSPIDYRIEAIKYAIKYLHENNGNTNRQQ